MDITVERLSTDLQSAQEQNLIASSSYDIEKEAAYLYQLLTEVLKNELAQHEYVGVAGAGSGGTILILRQIHLQTVQAAKFPRKTIEEALEDAKSRLSPIDIERELDALASVSHEHIIRFYDSYKIGSGLYCILTQYVEQALPLDVHVRNLLSQGARLPAILGTVSDLLFKVSLAIRYMHEEAHLVHFDIKPANILVDNRGRPFLVDLGFARSLDDYKDEEDFVVRCTHKYAHPDLTDPYKGGRVSDAPERARIQLKGKQLSPKFDLYAFGKTIQELLKIIEIEYGGRVHPQYSYKFLHFLACLLLDGKNTPAGAAGDFVSDLALECPGTVFEKHRISSAEGLTLAFRKLLGLYRIEMELPELDPWYQETLNVSDLGILSMSDRVKQILQHPSFVRLEEERQLGLMPRVYPTATHTRHAHSLGVFQATVRYLTALYYDPDSPIFRILFDQHIGSRILLASLLHDLGQSTYGHDLEEIETTEFSHASFTRRIISDDEIVDESGRSIAVLAEELWGITRDELIAQLEGELSKPFDVLLNDIIDGQLDADKTDYILRDSVDCRVPYGAGVDFDRFLRALTVQPKEHEPNKWGLRLSIKLKGKASAEAFAFARYQMYQSLYLHHTYRAMRAMFVTAGCSSLRAADEAIGTDLLSLEDLTDLFFKYVFRNERPKVVGTKESVPKLSKAIGSQLAKPLDLELDLSTTRGRTVHFFYALAGEKDKVLLTKLTRGQIYKRLTEIPLARFDEPSLEGLRRKLEWRERTATTEEFETEFVNSFLVPALKAASKVRESIIEDEIYRDISTIVESERGVVIDLPTRGVLSTGTPPPIIPDYKRRYFGARVHPTVETRPIMWGHVMRDLMRETAMLRVYLHPQLHTIVNVVMTPEEVQTACSELVKRVLNCTIESD